MRYFWVRFVCLFSFFVLFQPAVLAQTTPDEVVSSSSPNTAEQLTLTVAQDVETQIGTSPLFLTQHGPTLHSFAVTLFPTEQPFLSPLGVAFTLQLTDTKQLSSPLQLAVDYSTIPLEQRGAALTSRLQLSQGIQCDLTTQYCLDWQPLTVQNDLSAERFTVELSSFSADTIYKVTTGVNSDQGDYGYTPLLSSSSYQVDINSGAFATQYPIVVAPAPNVVLSYNSGMIDGMHNQKNNQAGPIGLGWTLQGGFITRHLKPCSTTDLNLCSDRDRYSITLNGVSSRLIWQSGTLYRLQNDPYWKVERLPTINANNDGEYWLVTTPNGTRYRFGADPTSVFYLPINGVNNIKRAWQWNLNEIEDTNHNVTQYSYELETNYYTTTRTEYIRAGQLSQISYTTQAGSAEVATARVRFISAGRCLDYVGSDFNCITSGTFPDTPLDLNCSDTFQQCPVPQPTFWSRRRIRAIVSEVFVNGSWSQVAYYDLNQQFPPATETPNSERKLWLDGMTRQGFPAVRYGRIPLNNRHDVISSTSPVTMFRINKITNELGGVVEISYGQSHPVASNNCAGSNGSIHLNVDCFVTTLASGSAFWNKWKVIETKQYNNFPSTLGLTVTETARYEYSAPAWHFSDDPAAQGDRYWNDYRGSDVVKVFDATGAYTEYRFFRGMNGDRTSGVPGNEGNYPATIQLSDGSTLTDSHWLAGKSAEISRYTAGNQRLSRNVTSYLSTKTTNNIDNYAPYNADAYFVGIGSARMTADEIKTTQIRSHYDSYGNVDITYFDGDVTTTADDRHTETVYQYDLTNYLVDRPQIETLFDGVAFGAGTVQTKTTFGYDGSGNLLSTKRYDQSNFIETKYRYDAYGRVIEQTDPNGNKTTTHYQPTDGYVDSVTNAKGQTTSFVIDPRWGVVTQTTDPNGLVTKQNYDVYGRLTEVRSPDQTAAGTPTSVSYVYSITQNSPSMIRIGQLTVATGNVTYLYRWVYVDGFGRTIQTQTSSATPNQFVAVSQRYDERGLLSHQSIEQTLSGTAGVAYRNPGWDSLAGHSRYQQDALGRVTRTSWQNGTTELSASQASYQGWQTTLTDANGNVTVQSADGFGQLTSVRDANNQTTTYQYDIRGGMIQLNDSAGNITTISYDQFGRKKGMTDPDMGVWYYHYDAVGNLIDQIDAKGQATNQYYDALNRPIAKGYSAGVTTPASYVRPSVATASTKYYYDETAYGKAIGKLTRVLDPSGGVAYVYNDVRGRLSAETRWINGAPRTYTQKYQYDVADRPINLTYPDGEVVTNVYNLQGLPRSLGTTVGVGGKPSYVNYAEYNDRNQITLAYYNNGASPAPAVQISYQYHDATEQFRLKTIDTTRNSAPFFKASYNDYDAVGNLKQVGMSIQGALAETVNFNYDALQRLTSSNGAYGRTYSYNAIGNITNLNGLSYSYAPAHPHAVTNVGADSYSYDANGNMTGRTEAGVAYTQTFDAENRLTKVVKGTEGRWEFLSDQAGQRRKTDQYDGAGTLVKTIYYPFAGYEVEIDRVANPSVPFDGSADPNAGSAESVPATQLYIDLRINPVPTAIALMGQALAGFGRITLLLTAVTLLGVITFHYRRKGMGVVLLLIGLGLFISPTIHAQTVTTTSRSHYFFNGQTIGTRTQTASQNSVQYLHQDQLGNTVMMSSEVGEVITASITKYEPFGGYRSTSLTNSNDIGYTGHHHNDEIGLIYMNAWYYLPGVGRFISADSLIPSPANPQSLNRYSYVGNNPLNGVDPDGHCYPVCTAIIGGVLGGTLTGLTYYLTTPAVDRNWGDALTAVGAGVVGGALIGTGVGAGAGIATIAAVGGGTGIVVSAEAYMLNNAIIAKSSFDTSDFLVASGVGSVEGAVVPFVGMGSILVSGVASGLQPALSNVFNGDKIDYRSVASGTVAGLFSGTLGYQVSKINIEELFTPSFGRSISKGVSTFNSLPYPITDPGVSRLGSLALPTNISVLITGYVRNSSLGTGIELTEGEIQKGIDTIGNRFPIK